MKLDFSQYHLKDKYRKVLEHLSDEDKIKTSIKNYSIEELDDICEYYNLRKHPLIKKLGLEKYGKDPENAYKYSINVIKGRWIEAENYIKTDTHYAYYYARDVIKGRWIEAEEYIKKDLCYAYHYAYYVIKGRWQEAEPYIKKDPENAYLYAKNVIGDENFWDNNFWDNN